MNQQAFVLRIAPRKIDRVPEALEENQIITGKLYVINIIRMKTHYEKLGKLPAACGVLLGK